MAKSRRILCADPGNGKEASYRGERGVEESEGGKRMIDMIAVNEHSSVRIQDRSKVIYVDPSVQVEIKL